MLSKFTKFKDIDVKNKFLSYPTSIKLNMLRLRELIFKVAAQHSEIGPIEETLKWGEPSYVTSKTKSGSTIRMDWKEKQPDQYALYFHCKTSLIASFKLIFGDLFRYQGNRAIIFSEKDTLPSKEISECIQMALTYNLLKKIKSYEPKN